MRLGRRMTGPTETSREFFFPFQFSFGVDGALQLVAGDEPLNGPAVKIKDGGGDIIGAVGISGDTSDKDEACAIAGIEAAGLKADPGAN